MRLLAGVLLALSLLAAACSEADGAPESGSAALSADTGSDTADTSTPTTATPETTTTSTTTTTTTEAPPPPFEYIDRGEYAVGVTTVTVDEGSERPLTVDVWFPLADGTTGELSQYTLLPGTYYTSPNAIDADFASIADGQFPLVVYSHGSGGQRWIHSDYTEFMASHGYVVVAPDHTGNTLLERFGGGDLDFELIAFQRPNDVTAVIDAVFAIDGATEINTALSGSLTEDLIVTGHSFGGFTSYASVSGVTTTSGTYEPDGRVDAIITLAPAANELLLTDELLASVDVPHLVMVGDSDDTTPIDPNVERPWALVPGSPSYRVELVAAEHETFTDLCNYNEQLPELESVPEFVVDAVAGFTATTCAPTVMPLDRAQEITNTFAVRFLDEITQGAPALSDDSVVYDDDIRFLTK